MTSRLGQAAGDDKNIVQSRKPEIRKRDRQRTNGSGARGRIDQGAAANTALNRTNPVNRRKIRQNRLRSATDIGEDIGQTISFIISLSRLLEGKNQSLHHHQQERTGSDHESDRQRLPTDTPQVAPQLGIEDAHHWIMSADTGASLTVTLRIRPSENSITRLAMAAVAAAWVTIMTLAPVDRFAS